MAVKATTIFLALVANLVVCTSAWADHTWICSISSAVAVDEDGTIGPPEMGERERPTFFRIDATKNELTLLAPHSRKGEVTKLDPVRTADGQWAFTAVEHGRCLSVIITKEGRLTLSIISDGAVWSIFGHALPEGDATVEQTAAAKDHAEDEALAEANDEATDDTKIE